MLGMLVASANPEIRQLLHELFERDPEYHVQWVGDVPTCLGHTPPPRILILHADLPDGNPFTVCQTYVQRGVPVLMIATSEQAEAAYEAGAGDVLNLPQPPVVIRRRVQTLVEHHALRAQTERDRWYQSIIENDIAGIFRSTLDGHVIYANRSLAKMLGYGSEQELMNVNIPRDIYLNPQDRSDLVYEELATKEYVHWQGILKRKDGSHLPVTISTRTKFETDGRIQYFEGIIVDDSQRHKAEEEARSERQFSQTLGEVTAALNASLDTEDVLEQIIQGVGRLMPLDTVSIMLLENDEGRVVRQHGMERYIDVTDMMQRSYPIHEVPTFEKIVTTRQAVIISDTRTDPDWRGLQSSAWNLAYMGLPIVARGDVIGMLNLDSAEPGAFSETDAHRMQAFADQAAIALDNARSVQELRAEVAERQRAEAAEREQRLMAEALRDAAAVINSNLNLDEVLSRMLDTLNRVMPVDAGIVMLIENGISHIVRSMGYEAKDRKSILDVKFSIQNIPNLREMVQTRQPYVILDTQEYPGWVSIKETDWIRSNVGAPIVINDAVIGFLILDSHQPHSYNQTHAQGLQAFANQAAIAIVNARTVEQLRAEVAERQRAEAAEREQRLMTEALREAAAIINSNLNLDAVLARILETLNRVIPVDVGNILLIEDGIARSARSKGYEKHGQQEMMDQLELSLSTTANLRHMVETRQPLVITDTRSYSGWVDIKHDQWILSNASAPIIVNDEVIGFLNLDSSEMNKFTQADGERLQAFANQVGIAIENARLYEASQRYNRKLEARVAERTAELERDRGQLAAILNSIGEGVMGVIFAPGTKHVIERHVNITLYHMFGYTADEWDLYKLRPDTVSPEEYETFIQNARRISDATGAYHDVYSFQRRDGTTVLTALTVNRIVGSDGRHIGSVTVYRDVSKEHELEARQARFVAAAAHELRTPLTGFKTRLDLTRRKPQDLERHLNILDEISNQMERLVNDLLNQARFEHGLIELHTEPIDLQPFIEHSVMMQQPLAEKKRISLLTEFTPQPVRLNADPDRLNQVLTNLIVNAITYTPDNGIVTVHLPTPTERGVLIQIEDTGAGIAPEHLPNLFEPFYRVRKVGQGMGLGLSIAREIVELHGGNINVESEVGRGTRFNVLLKG